MGLKLMHFIIILAIAIGIGIGIGIGWVHYNNMETSHVWLSHTTTNKAYLHHLPLFFFFSLFKRSEPHAFAHNNKSEMAQNLIKIKTLLLVSLLLLLLLLIPLSLGQYALKHNIIIIIILPFLLEKKKKTHFG